MDEKEKQLYEDLWQVDKVCEWFVDNKISTHFGEDKTLFDSILFASKQKNIRQLNIRYKHANVKQHSQVICPGCVLGETVSGEPMARKVINKINSKLRFLYRKNRYVTKELHRMLCSAFIQPHFDYVCPAWYPNLNEKTKKKIQMMQNKCIRFCLKLDKMHIGPSIWKSLPDSTKKNSLNTFKHNGRKALSDFNDK